MHTNSLSGTTVYCPDGTDGLPEDTFTADGWPTTVRFVGEGDTYGSGTVLDIDPDQGS